MPKINIIEQDLTTAGNSTESTNRVYVPGIVNFYADYKADGINLIEINSVQEFKSKFVDSRGKFGMPIVKETDGPAKFEKSNQYALALLQQGLPILFDIVDTPLQATTTTEDNVLSKIATKSCLTTKPEILKDKNNYNIKFITSGGYPNIEFTKSGVNTTTLYRNMLSIAAERGDCIALIDHEETAKYTNIINHSIIKNGFTDGKFSAMFTPWCTFDFPKWDNQAINNENGVNMPGSLAYLLAFANSIKNRNATWLAAAGAVRGQIPYLRCAIEILTESNIDKYALSDTNYIGTAVNPIVNINPYGTIVYGNRTLHKGLEGLTASSFLNIRQLSNDIKKKLYETCKYLTFEPNADLLWIKFKSRVTPLLDKMQTGNGIAGYQLKKEVSDRKAQLKATVKIHPIEAVEDFDIALELTDDLTNLSE